MSAGPPCLDDSQPGDRPLIEFTGKDPGNRDTEFLITVWWDGSGTIAFRDHPTDTWGPPWPLDRVGDGTEAASP